MAAVARRLKSCARAGDVIARLGGDEFCLLLEDVAGTEEAVRVSERVKECLQGPFKVGDYHDVLPITVSIRIAVKIAREDRSAGRLLRDADTAMCRVKRNGKAHHGIYRS